MATRYPQDRGPGTGQTATTGQAGRRPGGRRNRRRRGRGRQPTRPDVDIVNQPTRNDVGRQPARNDLGRQPTRNDLGRQSARHDAVRDRRELDQVSVLTRSLSEMRVESGAYRAPAGMDDLSTTPAPESDDEECLVNSLLEDFQCPVCLSLVRDPHLTDCCGHHFCAACIARVRRAQQPCPLCKESKFNIMRDKSFARRISQLKARCPKNEGCTWTGEYGSRHTHVCSFTCEFCAYNSTDGVMLLEHRNECPFSCSPHDSERTCYADDREAVYDWYTPTNDYLTSYEDVPFSERINDSNQFCSEIVELLQKISERNTRLCVTTVDDSDLCVGAVGGATVGAMTGSRIGGPIGLLGGAVLGGIFGVAGVVGLGASQLQPATAVLTKIRNRRELAAVALDVANKQGLVLYHQALTGDVVLDCPEREEGFLVAVLWKLKYTVMYRQ